MTHLEESCSIEDRNHSVFRGEKTKEEEEGLFVKETTNVAFDLRLARDKFSRISEYEINAKFLKQSKKLINY